MSSSGLLAYHVANDAFRKLVLVGIRSCALATRVGLRAASVGALSSMWFRPSGLHICRHALCKPRVLLSAGSVWFGNSVPASKPL